MNETNISAESDWAWVPFTWPWWVIAQLLLSTTGIIGNFIVIAVIIRRGASRFTSDVLIGSLAVADFSTSLWMIPRPRLEQIPDNWKGILYCRIEYSNLLMWISVVASNFILTVISVERLVAVKYPLKFKLLFSIQHSLSLIGASWLGGAIINIYTVYISRYDVSTRSCMTVDVMHHVHIVAGVVLFWFKYLIPISIMIGSHLAIIRELRAQARTFQVDGRNAPPPVQQLSQTMNKMTRTVLIVVIIFIVCWSPDQICFALFNLNLYPSYLYSDIYRVFVCLGFFTSCSNPFIYSIRNKKFRREVMELLCFSSRKLPKKRKRSAIFSPVVKARYIKTISGQIRTVTFSPK